MKVSGGAQMKVIGKKFIAPSGSALLKDPNGKTVSGMSLCTVKHGPKDTCIRCHLNISEYIDLTMELDDPVIPTASGTTGTLGTKLDSVTKVPKPDTKSATKSTTNSDVHVDLESDSESDIEFDLNPGLKLDSKPEIKPESKKYPKCEPGSSTLPFSLGTEDILANWTEPHPASGKRKNNCTILLPEKSEERIAVVDNFFQSFREGVEKFENEMSRNIDSAAGNYIIQVIIYLLCSFLAMC